MHDMLSDSAQDLDRESRLASTPTGESVTEASGDPVTFRLPDGRVPVLISSDSEELVSVEAAVIADFVRTHPEIGPGAVAGHLFRTRRARRYRALLAVSDRAGLLDALDAVATRRTHSEVFSGHGPAQRRHAAYVFPGQGGQRPGMGALFYRCSAPYRQALDECHRESMRLVGFSPRDYVLGDIDPDGPEASDIRLIQPALFMQMVALTAMWDAAGATPSLTVGHSQGEIAAAVRSGVLTLADGIVTVTERARLVHEIAPRGYTMAVVGISEDECESLLARNSGWAQLSVVNSAHILCISGKREVVLEIVESLTEEGKFAREIRVEYPAHTSIVSELHDRFDKVLDGRVANDHLLPGDLPCVGATLGEVTNSSMRAADYWFWNLRNRVRFDRAVLTAASEYQADIFIEIAEHPTLMLALGETLGEIDEGKDRARTIIGTSRRDAQALEEFTRSVAALAVADAGFRWDALRVNGSEENRTLPLEGFPNTVMRRVRLWADRDNGTDSEVNAPGWGQVNGRDVRGLRSAWIRLDRRKLSHPKNIVVLDPVCRSVDLAEAICNAAPGQGAVATLGSALDRDPAPADAAVLLVRPLGTDEAVGPRVSELLADACWRNGNAPLPGEFWLVTFGGEKVLDSDNEPDPVGASIAAALRCAAIEFPTVRFRHLDIPEEMDGAAEQIIAAIHVSGEAEMAVRHEQIFVKRLQVESEETRDDTWEPDLQNVVITGGTGKLGLEFAEFYAASGAKRITLLSRTGGDGRVARRLEALSRRTGVAINDVRCDITDPTAVAEMIDGLPDPVSFVVHAAMEYVETPIGGIGAGQIARAVDAKVHGLQTLLDACDGTQEPAVVVCSSLAATLGGRGQALYALANRMVEIEVARMRVRGRRAVAIAWGLWAVQGPLDDVGVARVKGAGVVPMDPAAALRVGLSELSGDRVVLAANWDELHEVLSLIGFESLIADLPDEMSASASEHPIHAVPSVADPARESLAVSAMDSDEVGTTLQSPISESGVWVAETIAEELRSAMGLTESEALDPEVPLVALGLDSLQALDFGRRVKAAIGRELPVEAVLGGASLREVIDAMC